VVEAEPFYATIKTNILRALQFNMTKLDLTPFGFPGVEVAIPGLPQVNIASVLNYFGVAKADDVQKQYVGLITLYLIFTMLNFRYCRSCLGSMLRRMYYSVAKYANLH
jgi:hypothetical protein